MKIFFAADHAGFELKTLLIEYVHSFGHETEDLGAHTLDPEDDYPPFMTEAGKAVSVDPSARAIILGGSGTGEAIVANRIPGVRCALYYGGSLEIVRLAREHNDANILSLGARFISETDAKEAVQLFLETPFSKEERHVRRIREIDGLQP